MEGRKKEQQKAMYYNGTKELGVYKENILLLPLLTFSHIYVVLKKLSDRTNHCCLHFC